MDIVLGQGTYGQVSVRNGKAVKKFSKLSHLIQEYIALKYLKDCEHVVKTTGADFANLELNMELYDCSMKKWIEEQRMGDGLKHEDIMILLKDILLGLIELHDRGLAHGDLKPGNVLIRREPLGAVLGDCGFVSIAKYAKVERTAAIYRDPVISYDYTHDMFSFGICFLEMVAEIKINRQASYEQLEKVVRDKIVDPEYRKIIYNLLHPDKSRRPSARNLLQRLFNINYKKWVKPNISMKYSDGRYDAMEPGFSGFNKHSISSISNKDKSHIRKLMKDTSYQFEINRAKKGYGALLSYIDNHKIERSLYNLYIAITLMILSSIFGKSGFRLEQLMELCEHSYNLSFVFKTMDEILSDDIYLNILLAPQ